jgi:BirA family transcriptional regulator, biotin operon repressor / biotin---[acetyl-CoA-carboxylase] ligase
MELWPEGVDKRCYATLDSTMSEAARLVDQLPAPTWIFAREQSAGRGRRGRDWVQPGGNFSATLIWRAGDDLAARAQRSFVAALALREALVAASGRTDGFSLKWPNDVLLNGGKLAGILLESIGEFLAIGFGVNLAATPEGAQLEAGALPPVSLLEGCGIRVTPEDFLTLLATAYARHEAMFTTYGFAPIRRDWLAHAAKLGEVITARTGSREITGIFETVDAEGSLVLNADTKRHRIAAADIYFSPPQ